MLHCNRPLFHPLLTTYETITQVWTPFSRYNLLLLPTNMVEVIMGPMTSSMTMADCYLTGEYCKQTHRQVLTSGENSPPCQVLYSRLHHYHRPHQASHFGFWFKEIFTPDSLLCGLTSDCLLDIARSLLDIARSLLDISQVTAGH